MPIKLDFSGNKFKLRILKSPNFDEDRTKLKQIPGRIPRYGLDENNEDVFSHWEIPIVEVRSILDKFPIEEILATDDAKQILENYTTKSTPIDQLPIISGELFFSKPLFSHQEDYVRINETKDKLLCSLFIGAGKTLASLERAKLLGSKKILILGFAIPNLIKAWVKDVRTVFDEPVLVYEGIKSKRQKLPFDKFNIMFVNYEKVGEFSTICPIEFDEIIIDEAHCLSNPKTKRYKDTAKLLRKNTKAKIQELTATPANHKLIDLWGPVSLIAPEIAGGYYAWKSRYEKVVFSIKKKMPNGKIIEIPIKTKPQNVEELKERLAPIMYRVKPDYKFEQITQIIPVSMTDRQKELYRRVATEVILELDSKKLTITNQLAQLTRLLQASEGYFNLDPTHIDSGKVEYIEHILKNTSEKIIVWSRFKPINEVLHRLFPEESVIYNGDLNKAKKLLSVWSFNGVDNEEEEKEFYALAQQYEWPYAPGEARLFFGTMSQRSTLAMNLQNCRIQMISSFDWNYNVIDQTSGRIKRMSQMAPSILTQFVTSEDTIEGSALQMILNNQKTVVQGLDGIEDLEYFQVRELINQVRRSL